MKIAGMVVIFICFASGGFIMGGRLNRRGELIEAFLDFFGFINYNLKHYNYSLEKIFISYKNELLEKTGFLDALVKSGKQNGVYKNTWVETIEAMSEGNGNFSFMKEEELTPIKNFGANLGRTRLELQLEACEKSRNELAEFYDENRREFTEKAQICRISGSLAGIFVCILVL